MCWLTFEPDATHESRLFAFLTAFTAVPFPAATHISPAVLEEGFLKIFAAGFFHADEDGRFIDMSWEPSVFGTNGLWSKNMGGSKHTSL